MTALSCAIFNNSEFLIMKSIKILKIYKNKFINSTKGEQTKT